MFQIGWCWVKTQAKSQAYCAVFISLFVRPIKNNPPPYDLKEAMCGYGCKSYIVSQHKEFLITVIPAIRNVCSNWFLTCLYPNLQTSIHLIVKRELAGWHMLNSWDFFVLLYDCCKSFIVTYIYVTSRQHKWLRFRHSKFLLTSTCKNEYDFKNLNLDLVSGIWTT